MNLFCYGTNKLDCLCVDSPHQTNSGLRPLSKIPQKNSLSARGQSSLGEKKIHANQTFGHKKSLKQIKTKIIKGRRNSLQEEMIKLKHNVESSHEKMEKNVQLKFLTWKHNNESNVYEKLLENKIKFKQKQKRKQQLSFLQSSFEVEEPLKQDAKYFLPSQSKPNPQIISKLERFRSKIGFIETLEPKTIESFMEEEDERSEAISWDRNEFMDKSSTLRTMESNPYLLIRKKI